MCQVHNNAAPQKNKTKKNPPRYALHDLLPNLLFMLDGETPTSISRFGPQRLIYITRLAIII